MYKSFSIYSGSSSLMAKAGSFELTGQIYYYKLILSSTLTVIIAHPTFLNTLPRSFSKYFSSKGHFLDLTIKDKKLVRVATVILSFPR